MDLASAEAELSRLQKEKTDIQTDLAPFIEAAQKEMAPHIAARDAAAQALTSFNQFCANNEAVGRAIDEASAKRHRERIIKRANDAHAKVNDIDQKVYMDHKDEFDRLKALDLEILGCQEVITMLKEEPEVAPLAPVG